MCLLKAFSVKASGDLKATMEGIARSQALHYPPSRISLPHEEFLTGSIASGKPMKAVNQIHQIENSKNECLLFGGLFYFFTIDQGLKSTIAAFWTHPPHPSDSTECEFAKVIARRFLHNQETLRHVDARLGLCLIISLYLYLEKCLGRTWKQRIIYEHFLPTEAGFYYK